MARVTGRGRLFCVLDENLRIVRYNDALEALCGRSGGDETRGRLFHEVFVVPNEATDVKRKLLGADEEVEHESALRRGDGSTAIVSWVKRRVTDSEGRPCIFFSGVDVTTLKREQEQLRASRSRIVQAADATRRKIERDLHDGAQQRLVSVALALRTARKALKDGKATSAARRLATIESELDAAMEELRELARGIHPAVLTDRGLPDALEMLAVRSTVPVEVEQATSERLDPQVEAAVYYIVAEALTNVAKYARARVASVRVFHQGGRLVAEVEDDGVGGAAQGSAVCPTAWRRSTASCPSTAPGAGRRSCGRRSLSDLGRPRPTPSGTRSRRSAPCRPRACAPRACPRTSGRTRGCSCAG